MKKYLLLSFLVGYVSCAMLRNYVTGLIPERQRLAGFSCTKKYSQRNQTMELFGCYKQNTDFTTLEKIMMVYYRKDD